MIDSVNRRSLLGMAATVPLAAQARSAPLQPAGADADLAGPWTRRGDIAVGGGRLHYAELGDGEPLVVLHKLGGWLADWRRAAPMLAVRRRVIAFDLPGHGESTMYGPPPYLLSVPQSAAMLLAALDQMGIDRCSIAGNSLGGIIGVVIAALWPQRVTKLAIVSVSLIGAMSREQLARQDEDRARLAAAAASKGEAAVNPQVATFATMDPSVSREHALGTARAGAWMRPSERGVGRVGVTDYLPRIEAPTLLLNADRGNYAKYGAVGMALIPHARREIVADAGSFIHQEKPAETAAAINRFLDA